MVAGAQAQAWQGTSRRRWARFQLQTPLDVTVLRSGIPDKLPGRSLNLGEQGLGAMLAGEVQPGETVALEMLLPRASDPLRVRATVRYQDKLRCGLEFVGLTPEQRTLIRDLAKEAQAEMDGSTSSKPAPDKEKGKEEKPETGKEKERERGAMWGGPKRTGGEAPIFSEQVPPNYGRRKGRPWVGWALVLLLAAIAGAISWWRWNRAWEQLESGLASEGSAPVEKAQVQVPAEVMQRLLIHRVEPTYPAEARQENLQGIIALDIIVGKDGSVESMHALNGPEVLARAAMDALRWWKFEPYRVNGEPAVAETTVAVEFKR
jgi:TonB family protein